MRKLQDNIKYVIQHPVLFKAKNEKYLLIPVFAASWAYMKIILIRTVITIFLLFLLLFSSSFSQTGMYNHPELDWKQIRSNRFTFIYHTGLEGQVNRLVSYAETFADSLISQMGVKPKSRIPVILSNYDDLSNGLATPLGHRIFLQTQATPRVTSGPVKWLPRVFSHEFTHMMNFYGVRGRFGFYDELIRLGLMPLWYIEGLAQMHGESWDNHRDLLLRSSLKGDYYLPLKDLDGFIGGDRITYRLLYEQGHSMIRSLKLKNGMNGADSLLRDYKRGLPLFGRKFKKIAGKNKKEFYKTWRREAKEYYYNLKSNTQSIEDVGIIMDIPLEAVWFVVPCPDKRYLFAVTGVKHFEDGVSRLYLYNKFTNELKLLDEPGIASRCSWNPDGRKIVFSKLHRGKNGSLVHDLYRYSLNSGIIRPLTKNMRAEDPVWSSSGKEIVFSRKTFDGSVLSVLEVKSRKIIDLIEPEDEVEVYSPSISPDGNLIAASYFFKDGRRGILLYDRQKDKKSYLFTQEGEYRDPCFMPDGENLILVSYENHIPNLVKININSLDKVYLSNIFGGLLNPVCSHNNGEIFCTGIHEKKRSYGIHFDPLNRLPGDVNSLQDYRPLSWNEKDYPSLTERLSQKLSGDSIKNLSSARDYEGYRNIRPHIFIPLANYYDKNFYGGAFTLMSDPLEKHSVQASFLAGKEHEFFFDYTGRHWYPALRLSAHSYSLSHTNFLAGRDYDERKTTLSASLQFVFSSGKDMYLNHFLYTGIDYISRSGINNEEFNDFFSVYLPWKGRYTRFTIGYYMSKHLPDTASDIHPKSGYSLSLLFRTSNKSSISDLKQNSVSWSAGWREKLLTNRNIISYRISGYFYSGEFINQSLPYITSPYHIRGLENKLYGANAVYGSFEIRTRLIKNLGLRLPLLYIEQFVGAGFFDFGKAWGDFPVTNIRPFYKKEVSTTTGFEIRNRTYFMAKLPVVLRFGMGMPVNDLKKRNFYFIVQPNTGWLTGIGRSFKNIFMRNSEIDW